MIAGGADVLSRVPITVSDRLSRSLVQASRGKSLGARLAPFRKIRPRDLVPVAPAIAGVLWLFMFAPSIGIVSYWLRAAGLDWNHLLNGTHAMILNFGPAATTAYVYLQADESKFKEVTFTYTVAGVALAQFVIAAAFAIRTMRGVFDHLSARPEDVAMTLGCSRAQAVWHVTLPAARRGMFAAASVAWARSLGEFGPVLVFAGLLLLARSRAQALADQHDSAEDDCAEDAAAEDAAAELADGDPAAE